jgi:quercetin dioxygenase-like cupin family protein
MKPPKRMLATSLLAAVAGISAVPAHASEEHKLLTAQDIKWAPAPPSIPAGAQVAVLYGNPGKDGMFAMRLKMPKGYRIAPHTHPKPEIVTVISGTARLGMGKTADRAKAKVLPAGSFFAMSPGMPHYFLADDETVIQLNSTGPWSLTYVDPKDDPRQNTQ